nr:MAG TPA: hypothetical protein [Caudoviricetes sp.]
MQNGAGGSLKNIVKSMPSGFVVSSTVSLEKKVLYFY